MMAKFFLNSKQVQQLVLENRFKVDKKKVFFSRCVEAVYENKGDLSPVSIPGGDLGELALFFSTANVYGFSVDREKAYEILVNWLGGEKNFYFHQEKSFQKRRCLSQKTKPLISPCFFISDYFNRPNIYNLNKEDLNFLTKKIKKLTFQKKPVNTLTKERNFEESALLIVYGNNWNVYPRSLIKISEEENKKIPISILVFHQSLIDQRHRQLVKELMDKKGVKLYWECDEEYLYEVLSIEMENFLFEGLKENYQGLPIFKVEFDDEGSFTVEEMGKIL